MRESTSAALLQPCYSTATALLSPPTALLQAQAQAQAGLGCAVLGQLGWAGLDWLGWLGPGWAGCALKTSLACIPLTKSSPPL